MMSRTKTGLLALMATLAVSVAAASAASATGVFIVGGTELASTETVEIAGIGTKIEFIAGSTMVVVTCEEDGSTGTIESKGKSKGELNFKECNLEEVTSKGKDSYLAACTVVEPIAWKITDELTGTKSMIEDELKPSGTSFGTIELTNDEKEKEKAECSLKGSYEVKGTQICSLPDSEVEAAEHEMICVEEGSKLEIGKEKLEKAKLVSTEGIGLVSGKDWFMN